MKSNDYITCMRDPFIDDRECDLNCLHCEDAMFSSKLEEFIEHLKACSKCSGPGEEGCAVCGEWFPYDSPEKDEEYYVAKSILGLE